MNRTLSVGKSGLDAFQRKMDSIANNVANSQTMGYKKTTTEFNELLRDQIGKMGTPLSEEMIENETTIGNGVKGDKILRIFEQGMLIESSRQLDMAIEGEGFFRVKDETGNFLLTRVGNFRINEQGKILDSNGYELSVHESKDLSDYDENTISINNDGEITGIDEKGKKKSLGRILLYNVENKEIFDDAGKGYLKEINAIAIEDSLNGKGLGKIKQGYNEMSNVDIGEEMVQMIIAQRAYQMNLKSVQSADEMMSMVNDLKR